MYWHWCEERCLKGRCDFAPAFFIAMTSDEAFGATQSSSPDACPDSFLLKRQDRLPI
jgi:hypothetical protein